LARALSFRASISTVSRLLPQGAWIWPQAISALARNSPRVWDETVKQLQQVLKADPKNANALFNLGMMKWKGRDDAAGAIATWQELLRSNPNLDRNSTVEQMMPRPRASQLAASPAQPPVDRILRQKE
jgi:cytochrome c-type biogenesis protein CcmH/NrfG